MDQRVLAGGYVGGVCRARLGRRRESPPTQDDCCYTSCSCEETTGDELPGTFPPGDPVKAVYTDFAPGAPTGVHAAESVKHDVVLSPATLNGFPSGAGLVPADAFADAGDVCRAIAGLNGGWIPGLLAHPLDNPGGVQVASPQGTQQSTQPDGTGSHGAGPGAPSETGADPVDPVTGEYVITETDLAFPGYGIPFQLVRTYRSRVDLDTVLGPGWDFSLNQRLVNLPTVDADGTPSTLAYQRLAFATKPMPDIGAGDGTPETTCGPSLALSTGEGTTIRFNEIAASGDKYSLKQAQGLYRNVHPLGSAALIT